MRRSAAGLAFLFALFWFASTVAQTPGPRAGSVVLTPIAPTGGRGVSNATLLSQADVRVLRVDIEPDGVRNIHSHNDVQFHLFIPVSGSVRLEVATGPPLELRAWQAQLIKGGTQHGFSNIGTSLATVMEVFVVK